MSRLTALDLFAGAGGLSLGLVKAGFEVLTAVDNWQIAVDTYTKNFDHGAICADVAAMTSQELMENCALGVGDLALLAGGPPCQGFSIQRIGADVDDRNQMVLEFARFIADLQPRTFLMENVPGLLGRRGTELADEFLRRVVAAGYTPTLKRVNAVDFGVPQNRKRVILVGHRRGETEPDWKALTVQRPVTVMEALDSLPEPAPSGTVNLSDPLHAVSRLSPLNQQRIALIPPGGGFEDLPVELRVACHKNGAAAIGHRGVYGRLHPDRPAGTITARFDSFTRGRFGHPTSPRDLTLREGARLQTFPDDFVFLGNREEVAARIGNAVPPLMAQRVAEVLVESLND